MKNQYTVGVCKTAALSALLAIFSVAASAAGAPDLPRVKQTLVAPPLVPEHDQEGKGGPKIVEVTLTIEEKEMVLDGDGTTYQAMTFGGTNPGPLIVVNEGDYVELTLINPEGSALPHNIDLHNVTGALGGAGLTHVQPGESKSIRFKAIKPGVFVYHCAPGGAMIPYHVVSGMHGAIMVIPKGGMKDKHGKPIRYDRAYYIGENDWYVPKDDHGHFKKYGDPLSGMGDIQDVMRTLTPTHVTLGGKAFAYTGENALKAKVGETVLFIHSQANRDSRPHLIGGHGDNVWERGNLQDTPATDLETWFIAGGSAGAATYTFRQPGLYVYLTHNLIEAVMLGAAAHVNVEGKWNDDLLTQIGGDGSGPKTEGH